MELFDCVCDIERSHPLPQGCQSNIDGKLMFPYKHRKIQPRNFADCKCMIAWESGMKVASILVDQNCYKLHSNGK